MHTERGLLTEKGDLSNNIFSSVNKYFRSDIAANLKIKGRDALLETDQVEDDGLPTNRTSQTK